MGRPHPPPIWGRPLPPRGPAALSAPPLPSPIAGLGAGGARSPHTWGAPPAPPIPRCVPGRNWPLPARTIPSPPCSSRDIVFAALAKPSPPPAAPSDPGIALLPAEILLSLAAVGLSGGGTAVPRASPLGRGARGTPSYGAGQVGLLRAKRFGVAWGGSSHRLLPRGVCGGAMQCPTASWGAQCVAGGPAAPIALRQGKGLLVWKALRPTMSPLCPHLGVAITPLECHHAPTAVTTMGTTTLGYHHVPVGVLLCPHWSRTTSPLEYHHPSEWGTTLSPLGYHLIPTATTLLGWPLSGRCCRAVASWLRPTPPSLLLSPHPFVPSPPSHPPAPLRRSYSWDWGWELRGPALWVLCVLQRWFLFSRPCCSTVPSSSGGVGPCRGT